MSLVWALIIESEKPVVTVNLRWSGDRRDGYQRCGEAPMTIALAEADGVCGRAVHADGLAH
jgi:hypothetical protein